MKDIPGELHERPWVNLGATRPEAFKLAFEKGDYILFMDADDILEFDREKGFPILTADLYHMWRGNKGFTYLKPQIVKANLPWRWVGVTHEYLDCLVPYSSETLEAVKYVTLDGGAASKEPKRKFQKNVDLLEQGLKEEPDNARYAFYLGESYRDLGEKGKALEVYQKRVNMGGWSEETFWSMLQIGHMLRDIGLPSNIVETAYYNAHEFRPHRPEPVYYLAEIYNEQEDYEKAYAWIKSLQSIPKPPEKASLFNIDWIEEYGLLFQLSICSYYVEKGVFFWRLWNRLQTFYPGIRLFIVLLFVVDFREIVDRFGPMGTEFVRVVIGGFYNVGRKADIAKHMANLEHRPKSLFAPASHVDSFLINLESLSLFPEIAVALSEIKGVSRVIGLLF